MHDRWLIILFLGALLLRAALAAWIPLSADEAYFALWGRHLAAGYYDHPPMVGWLLYALQHVSATPFVLRIPAVVAPVIVAAILYFALRPIDRGKAAWVAALFLLTPVYLLNVLITTDTPLLMFTALSLVSVWHAERTGRRQGYVWGGIFLGLAFFSKYFAVLLLLAYVVYLPLSMPDRRRAWGLVFLFAAPFILYNIAWNYNNCWDNLLFNLANRHEGDRFEVRRIGLFLLSQLYILGPVLIYAVVRHYREFISQWQYPVWKVIALAWLVPMAVWAMLSPVKVIGLHWTLSVYPALFLLLILLPSSALRMAAGFAAVFSAAHLVVLFAVGMIPLERWQNFSKYPSIVLAAKGNDVAAAVLRFGPDWVVSAKAYSTAALLGYHLDRVVPVFGRGSSHARQDDILTDFRALHGRNLLIVLKRPETTSDYARYFSRVERRVMTVHGAEYTLILGSQFNYALYRDDVLSDVRDRYYRLPWYLPEGRCPFCARYFPGTCQGPIEHGAMPRSTP